MYCAVYGALRPNTRVTLVRLALETGACDTLCGLGYEKGGEQANCDLYDLAITPAGELISLYNPESPLMPKGLNVARLSFIVWRSTPRYMRCEEAAAQRALSPRSLYISPDTGLGLIHFCDTLGAVSVFNSAKRFKGFDMPLRIADPDGGIAARATMDEWAGAVTISDSGTAAAQCGFVNIPTCAPSPDGTRALLPAARRASQTEAMEYALLMLDLSALACEPFLRFDANHAPLELAFNSPLTRNPNAIEWPADDLVLMNNASYEYYALYRLTAK